MQPDAGWCVHGSWLILAISAKYKEEMAGNRSHPSQISFHIFSPPFASSCDNLHLISTKLPREQGTLDFI